MPIDSKTRVASSWRESVKSHPPVAIKLCNHVGMGY